VSEPSIPPRVWAWTLLAGLAFAAFLLIDARPLFDPACATVKEQIPSPSKTQKGNQSEEDGRCSSVIVPILRDFHRHRDDINAASTIVIALFTIILGVFTISLAKSTRVAADATKESADALVSAERSHVFIYPTESFSAHLTKASMSPIASEGTLSPRPVVNYMLKNLGKTPAILKEVRCRFVHLRELPPVPDYAAVSTAKIAKHVLASDGVTDTQSCRLEDDLSVHESRKIGAESALWFYGLIVWSDIFGIDHERGFLWTYAGDGFRPDYREAYNKNT
jgi:hypothetical protein